GVYGSGNYGVYGSGTPYGVYGIGNYGVDGGGSSYVNGRGGYWVANNSSQGAGGDWQRFKGNGGLGTGYSRGNFGVAGTNSSNGNGLYGYSAAGLAAWLNGNVAISGTCTGCFGPNRIDHPLDPENKYLSHVAVQSDGMLDIYSGNVTTDARGEAVVTMPDWFEALNKDFRYQLTSIGAPGSNLYVAEEIHDNRFKIAGGKAGMKVSWLVTGVRHDPYANAHRIPVEESKPAAEKG